VPHEPASPLVSPDPWREAVAGVADDARRMEPVATGVLGFAVVLYAVNVVWPLLHAGGALDAGRRVIEALPASILIVALWDVRKYLLALADGGLWGPAASRLLARVGDTLQTAAFAGVLAVPNLVRWIGGEPGGLSADLDPGYLALGGLGLLLSLVGRAVGRVVEVAGALKAENEEIV
jgi:hypothetical protein